MKSIQLIIIGFRISVGRFGAACKESTVSDSPGLVDFAIGLVNSALNLPNGQVMFFEDRITEEP